ncbi:MAG: hypothetical protein LBS62_03180, partial [Clostridiales bacterium]|nr:hypothetical protein [Clostridiales bacterium]
HNQGVNVYRAQKSQIHVQIVKISVPRKGVYRAISLYPSRVGVFNSFGQPASAWAGASAGAGTSGGTGTSGGRQKL